MVSVIIPTYNAAPDLARLLRSISVQVGLQVETVVVDQSSDDGTAGIATSFGARVISVPRGPRYAPPGAYRNVGARASHGDVLVHLDADMELPHATALSSIASSLDSSHAAAIIPEVDVADSFWTRVKAIERRCYWGTALEAARVVRRDVFDSVGGYHDEIASGEDWWLSQQLSDVTQLARPRDVFVYHHTGAASLPQLVRKKIDYGRAAHGYRAQSNALFTPRRLVREVARAYLRHRRLILQDPAHYLAVPLLRIIEALALSVGARLHDLGSRERISTQPD